MKCVTDVGHVAFATNLSCILLLNYWTTDGGKEAYFYPFDNFAEEYINQLYIEHLTFDGCWCMSILRWDGVM